MSSGDTRLYPGEPPPRRPRGIQLDRSAAGAPATSVLGPGLAYRLFAGALRRLVAAVPVALFGYVQYAYFLQDRRLSHFFKPYRALGPLYFLANQSPADDWIGYALLAVAVPCLLVVVVWPRRWTMLLAIVVALAWVFPGCIEDRNM
jgi:hypothetical protein